MEFYWIFLTNEYQQSTTSSIKQEMKTMSTDHHRRLRLLSFLNDVLPGREYEETLNIVTGGLLIGLEMLLKQKRRREKLLLVTYLPGTIFTPITSAEKYDILNFRNSTKRFTTTHQKSRLDRISFSVCNNEDMLGGSKAPPMAKQNATSGTLASREFYKEYSQPSNALKKTTVGKYSNYHITIYYR
ncbi:hypothetical protein YC2023_007048 [Brassica napus]